MSDLLIDVILIVGAAVGTFAYLGALMCGYLTKDAAKELHYLKLRLAAIGVAALAYGGLAAAGYMSGTAGVTMAIIFATPALTEYPSVKTRAAAQRGRDATAARLAAEAEAQRLDAIAAELGLPTITDLTRTPAATQEQQP